MIQIIKPGKIDEPKRQIVSCPRCSCIFSFTDDEDYGDFYGTINKYVDCPTCKRPIQLPEKTRNHAFIIP